MFVSFRGAAGDKFVFMDDNATCHRTLAVQDCLDSEGIQRLCMASAFSRSKTPLKMCGMILGGKLLVETILRQTKNTLIRALTEEWDKLPQQLLDNVVQSMEPIIPEFDFRVPSFHPKNTKARFSSTHGPTSGNPL
ncbi:hypothetical protein TNCV_2713611 [Trichonephila clavipes]|nr:hypothetical protein TNCV_2713611 [Trichonephila clavipes]